MGHCLSKIKIKKINIFGKKYVCCSQCNTFLDKYKTFLHQERIYCNSCVPEEYFLQDQIPLLQNDTLVNGRYMCFSLTHIYIYMF